jgi:hypothetical protein
MRFESLASRTHYTQSEIYLEQTADEFEINDYGEN